MTFSTDDVDLEIIYGDATRRALIRHFIAVIVRDLRGMGYATSGERQAEAIEATAWKLADVAIRNAVVLTNPGPRFTDITAAEIYQKACDCLNEAMEDVTKQWADDDVFGVSRTELAIEGQFEYLSRQRGGH